MGTLTEDEVVVLESLDFEVKCQAKKECPNPAQWLMRCLHCKASSLFCGPCRVHYELGWSVQITALSKLPGLLILQCGSCGAIATRFEDLFTWERFEAPS